MPPNLDDQHHNVIEDRNPHPPLEEGGKDLFDDINFDNRPLSEFYKPGEIREYFGDLFDDDDNPPLEDAEDNAAREGEPEAASKAKKRAALLDDVPHSIKKNLATVSAPAPPHGYFWHGESLIKKKGKNRPDCIDHSSWRSMSKRQRAEAVLEHERKVQSAYEAEYEAAVKAVPAMPVLSGKGEEHRERLLPLLHKKLLEVSSDMYAVVAKVLSPKEVSNNPAAQAALDKEWQKLVDKGCWVEKKVREYEAVASEAKKDNAKVHLGNIFEIGTLKGAELKEGDPNRKYKGRSVFQGNKVVDENSDHALFAEMSSSPASMEAGNTRCVRLTTWLRHPAGRCEASIHPGTIHRSRDLG